MSAMVHWESPTPSTPTLHHPSNIVYLNGPNGCLSSPSAFLSPTANNHNQRSVIKTILLHSNLLDQLKTSPLDPSCTAVTPSEPSPKATVACPTSSSTLANADSSLPAATDVIKPVQTHPPTVNTHPPKKRKLLERVPNDDASPVLASPGGFPAPPQERRPALNGSSVAADSQVPTPTVQGSPPPPLPATSDPAKRPDSLALNVGAISSRKKQFLALITSNLVSPDTPRPKRSFVQQYINGHAYTTLGLKSSTRTTYCCIYRAQPMFVPQETDPRLSMYSNWQVAPSAQPEIEGLKPGQMIALYRNIPAGRDSRIIYSTAHEAESNVLTHSSYWGFSRAKEIGDKSCQDKKNDAKEDEKGDSELELEPSFSPDRNEKSSPAKAGRYVCEICDIPCSHPHQLLQHLYTIHRKTLRPFGCVPSCRRVFRSQERLLTHARTCPHVVRDCSSASALRVDTEMLELLEKVDAMCRVLEANHEGNIILDDEDSSSFEKSTSLTDNEEDPLNKATNIPPPPSLEQQRLKEQEAVQTLLHLSGQNPSNAVVVDPDFTKISPSTPRKEMPVAQSSLSLLPPSDLLDQPIDLRVSKQPSNHDQQPQQKSPPTPPQTLQRRSLHQDPPISLLAEQQSPSTHQVPHFFPQDPYLLAGQNQGAGEGPVACSVCAKVFPKLSQLRLHHNIHYLEQRGFRCETCAVSFRTSGHLEKHKRSASHLNKLNVSTSTPAVTATTNNPRPFKCEDCKVAFRIQGHLAKHLRSKLHIMRLECLGKVPFGLYAELERTGRHTLAELDTTDCNSSLHSLKAIAKKWYGSGASENSAS